MLLECFLLWHGLDQFEPHLDHPLFVDTGWHDGKYAPRACFFALPYPMSVSFKPHGDAFDASTSSTGSTGSKRHWLWSDDEDGGPSQKRKRGSVSTFSFVTSSGRPSLTGSDHRPRLPRFRDDFREFCNHPGPVFVDKTRCLLELPDQFRYLLLRPPTFGKTAFLSTMTHFYDVHGAEQFTEHFGSLAVATEASHAIPRHNQHLCLCLTLSNIYVDVDVKELAADLATKFFTGLQLFLVKYATELKLCAPETYLADQDSAVFGEGV
ncbi:hypothetical protein DFH07DRAFT_319158 [Mycena maculata]|uniref:AAA-ATPase-like domain-containing protein n=1 Tax=Mycena maculata TaxID=230809 RepID=A0AAD7NZU1_9AGAR|nr:hypothetical protein DFH07DRAFT_319158 [Mycena maculata]